MTVFLTVPSAARQVGVSRRVLSRAIASGQLAAFQLDTPKRPRVRLADVVSWIESTRLPRSAAPPTPGFDAKRVAASLRPVPQMEHAASAAGRPSERSR